ncbi:MAG: hypothetical protein HDQ87_08030 [Clostridia bacterium]|nr:hypothetical protein [Clostridia bacterium]
MSGLQIFGFVTVFGTIAVAVVCFILYAVLHRRRHYRCPNCGKRFKTSAATSFVAARDGVDKRMICPNCGHFGYMEDHRDEELNDQSETDEKESPGRQKDAD